ncbi:MAG: hypothetical protein JOZ51_09810 [Chloroflexi bacterium]|nr:hypothetical protein [Chloroflexota bacterium]
MDPLELYSHSFIIRIWREQTDERSDRAIWRGYIRHVPSRQQRYLRSFEDIVFFIIDHVEPMNVHIGLAWRVWRRLRYRRQPKPRDQQQ